MDPKGGFAFVFTILEPDFKEDVKIIPLHIFRKADKKEITHIKEALSCFGDGLHGGNEHTPYEFKWEKNEQGNGYSGTILPDKDWKYYIIAFQGSNTEIQQLSYASNLIKNHLDFSIIFMEIAPDSFGTMFAPSTQNTYSYYCNVHNHDVLTPTKITAYDLSLIKIYYDLIKTLSPDNFLNKAINNFHTMKNIPHESELLILGYFAIIESIIAHEPTSRETLDSINHQFTNKLILLRKRFDRPLNLQYYFKEEKEDIVWKRLYSYRSCLAHGSVPDFSKTFKILKDKKTILSFIHETLKLTIIAALKEPELITDLRNC